MSMPGAEDTVGEGLGQNAKGNTSASDRRAGKSRVSFEALVAVGDANGAGGFEAESVDVSQTGMRLRTAYLPDVGERLLCRFEGDVGEIVAEGEVTWRREASRGGEFGLRFTKFETTDAEATLRAMCARINGTADPSAGPIAVPGTRVRLHIEGLGSPMKARVRDSLGGEIQVGSNLEFLKVGRALELEDMDHGEKKPATVDAVKVEVDPLTRIPQLVVSLRFDGQDGKKFDVKETAKDALNTLGAIAKRATKSGDDRTDSKDVDAKAARISSTLANAAATLRPRASAARTSLPSVPPRGEGDKSGARDESAVDALEARTDGSSGNDDGESSTDGKKNVGSAVRDAAAKASGSAKAAMGAVGPAMGRFGARAKDAVTGLLASIRKRREVNGDQEGQTFRRTTSAPPAGALRSAGRKLVREDREETDVAGGVVKSASRRRAALVGGALGLVAVLAVVGGARFLGGRTDASADGQSVEANASASAAALPAPDSSAVAAAPGADGTATPVANVPLFGATPLSTTEPVPAMPTQPDGTIAPTPAAADANAAETGTAEAGSNDDGDDEDNAGKGDGKQFGHGSVRSPIVLKIKTDGDIETVNGAAGAMGFTISLPGRRAKSSAAELMRKDKRIASLNIVNNPTGSEISIQFKDGVPGYMAKAKGNRLDISLGTDAKKVAKAGSTKSKKGSKKTTKKSAKKGAKKP